MERCPSGSAGKDVGVTLYLLLVALWFALQLPIEILAPVFFADPASKCHVCRCLACRAGWWGLALRHTL